MITVAQLIACGIGPTQAKLFAQPLSEACDPFDIDTPARLAAFLAQCAHESARFTRLEESLYYRTAERIRQVFPLAVPTMAIAGTLVGRPRELANVAYANRLGNGDVASGDGWRYRGRGLIQLTGRANYLAAGQALQRPYKESPDLVAQPTHACLTAAWYFSVAGCNELADAGLIDKITRKVNGPGMVAAGERRSFFDEALRALS